MWRGGGAVVALRLLSRHSLACEANLAASLPSNRLAWEPSALNNPSQLTRSSPPPLLPTPYFRI